MKKDEIDKPDEQDNKDTASDEGKEEESEVEKAEAEERPNEVEAPVEEENDEEKSSKKEEVPNSPEQATDEDATVEEVDNDDPDSSKRSSVATKRWGDEGHHEDEEDDHHHHGHHEHEHEHHHHGHHHGFVHEWGEEEGGEHHGHQGHGHHEHEHEHEHEHGHGHEHMGHHGYGGYGDGGGGGYGGGWGRSQVLLPAPPIAFHCRDMISADGKRHTKRFCVPIGHNGGYGWPYFHGYPGVGLGLWGWGHPWIKSKVHKAKKEKKDQRDIISKKQTVHFGYGYAGMGSLVTPNQENNFKKSVINKRQFGGAPALTNGVGYGGHSQPYGHPVTHPGFTTMGFPGHALASTDVRNQIRHPKVKRQVYEEEESYADPSMFQEMDSQQLIEEDAVAPSYIFS